jgi:hypothetical protein
MFDVVVYSSVLLFEVSDDLKENLVVVSNHFWADVSIVVGVKAGKSKFRLRRS